MVDREKVERKIQQLNEFLDILENLSKLSTQALLKDLVTLGSIKYYLQISIECCIDMANHIIASERYRSPNDYGDTFTILSEKGIITEDFAQVLKQMVKFRNRIVHIYGEVDDHYVIEILKNRLDDFQAFRNAILKFLEKSK
jgi:uncharacterized protein YutE (UPF0331/DUF86 family)